MSAKVPIRNDSKPHMKNDKFKLIVALLLFMIVGCSESNFELAQDSRLPKCFTIPAGMTRADITITFDFYIVPTEKAIFTMYDKKGNKLAVKKGKRYGGYLYPKQLENTPDAYQYEIIIVDGVIDILEFRRMEPIFYLTDNPAIWKTFGIKQS